MAPALNQKDRFGVLGTPLGKDGNGNDKLALVRFDGNEGLSELFHYTVEAVSLEREIDFSEVMGEACTVTIKTRDGVPTDRNSQAGKRIFNGILVAAESLGLRQGDFFGYRLLLRPWLWVLTRTTNCRIYQEKDVPTIIKEVFEANGFSGSDFEFLLDGSFPKLEYCVQYRETDFTFVTRLMEKEGIYYFFRHEGNSSDSNPNAAKHVLVLTNSMSKHKPIPGHETTGFSVTDQHIIGNPETMTDWNHTRQMRSGRYIFNDYNFEKPRSQMLAQGGENSALVLEAYKFFDKEVYEYPGNYKTQDEGKRYATIALEAEQAPDHRRFGSGHAISLFPGGLTTLAAPPSSTEGEKNRIPPPSEFKKYLVVRAVHTYGTQDYRSGPGALGEDFQGRYEFQESSSPFRAPIVTPKPKIYGIQTAKVVTKNENSTEEIDVEKLSEIYVHFYWDRNQQKEYKERRSTKLRCAQLWASKKWGGQFIPRVGMEALIEFLEGDPDRPIVTGCVYNDDNQPPYDLPGKKTISGIKSDSTKGSNGFNEWNFEDKKGSEQINVHAQKDLNVVVLNNETRDIGHDLTTTITNSEKRTIGEKFVPPKGSPSRETTLKSGDDNLTIQLGDQTVAIPLGNQTTTAGLTITTTANISITIGVGPSIVSITPGSVSITSPTINLAAVGAINLAAATVNVGAVLNTPSLLAGAAVIGGIPI